ncbi:S8 family peptidase [Saccharothrix coeruleofusca]|uniref:Serine protease n=1 Tax=Saccharothrix coeruleofusca TaxID=33919 RepID=A0A918AM92_9PSEU|nr:S8 family peptidase [Saccharothrix coeruleofusca]MBP2339365.1 subtilisin family serine protease [Saccharothrix coeruleofusca]GGP58209.1 serine protease [Saccharothrix coeruleofusca]
MAELRTSWTRRLAGVGLATGTAFAVTAALTTFTSSAAEGEIRGLGTEKAVKDSYIVVLKDVSTASASSLSAKYQATVKHTYTRALHGFSATMSEAQARKLAADPAVAYVQQDAEVSISATQAPTPSWGLDRIDQAALPLDNSYTYPNEGEGVTAYIIDTGIRFSHSDFAGRASSGRDTVDNDDDSTDCNGHGTHVAGTVGGSTYGVAKKVKLVGVRVLNCSGSGTYAGVIAGIDWVTANAVKPAVANMSLGGGADATVDQAVRNSIASGVTYGLAGGNSSGADACGFSPARTPEAITVGSTTNTDARSSFSNIGTCLDIFAPGSNITSAWHTGDTATNTISGTSMATPHVVGAAALFLAANPTATPQQVRDGLVDGATSDVVTSPGNGSPNKLLRVVGGTGPQPIGCPAKTNDADVAVPDLGTGVSTIAVTDCAGKASTAVTIEVHVKHTYRGDLSVHLVTPSGAVRQLRAQSGSDGTDNLDATYTVNLSTEDANGNWQLRVRDWYNQDTGYIDSWTLDL